MYENTDVINGISFQGVGDGTTVEFVQVHNCKDDGIEISGGTVNMKYVVSTGNGDDQFDWMEGWQGKVQFVALAVVEGESSDPRGIEGDNNYNDNYATPRSTVEIYNVSVIGNTVEWNDDLIRIRRGTYATFGNVYAAGGPNVDTSADGLKTTEVSTECNVDTILIEGNIDSTDATDSKLKIVNITESIAPVTWFLNINAIDTLANLQTNNGICFVPTVNLGGLNPPDDGFFDTSANFIGAVSAADNWLAGWTAFPEN